MDGFTGDQEGNLAETALVTHATRLGLEVYPPVGAGGRSDMFCLFPNAGFSRVQSRAAEASSSAWRQRRTVSAAR